MAFLASIAGPPDKRHFAQLAIDALRQQGVDRAIEFDLSRFQLVIGEPGQALNFLYLGNAYEEYCNVPHPSRDAVLRRFAAMAQLQGPPPRELALRHVLPRVRDRAYYAFLPAKLRLHFGAQPNHRELSVPYRPLGEWFAAGLVYDLPTAVMEISSDQLAGWELTFEEGLELAISNLRAISTQPFQQVAEGVFASPHRDNHDPARLLLADKLLELPLKGAPVVTLPNRDTLLVTGSEDEWGLEELADLTKMALLEPRPMAAIPLVLGADGWAPFLPTLGHKAFSRLHTLVMRAHAQSYAEQKSLLEASSTEDRFVASFSVVRHGDSGRLSSCCSWSRGVDSLLPRTDEISLVDLEGMGPGHPPLIYNVPWERAQRVVGHRMIPEDCFPPRWRVDSFPSAEEMAELVRAMEPTDDSP